MMEACRMSFFMLVVLAGAVCAPAALATRASKDCAGQTGATQGTCPPGQPLVNCLVAPCSTPACQEKCAKLGDNTTVLCTDTYCGKCDCTCCVKKYAGCRQEADCCPGTICALSNACAVNLFAMCTTTCVPPAEAASNCRQRNRRCNPDKLDCCNSLSCQKKHGLYSCQSCKYTGETCDPQKRNQCCPYHKCTAQGGKYTCQQDPNA